MRHSVKIILWGKIGVFVLGSLFGVWIASVALTMPTPAWFQDSMFQWVIILLMIPGMAGLLFMDYLLVFLCWATGRKRMCEGLVFDGGPSEWLEETGFYASMIVVYGLIFLLISEPIVRYATKSRRK